MPSILIVLPSLLVVAAVVTWALDRAGLRAGRWPVVVACWLALGALIVGWPTGGRVEDWTAPVGSTLQPIFHLDALAAAFMLFLLVPTTLLLTWRPWAAPEAALAAIAAAAALLAVEAGGVVQGATLAGIALTALVLLLQPELTTVPWRLWLISLAAVLGLGWAGITLEVVTGTAQLAAIPPLALHLSLVVLLMLSALLLSGALPGLEWPRTEAALAAALLVPIGFHLVFRVHGLAGGGLAGDARALGWLDRGLAITGAVTILLAAVRGQRAPSRRRFLDVLLPTLSGLVLLGLGTGTPAGQVAALTTVAAMSLVVTMEIWVERLPAPAFLGAVGLAVGLPPGLAFGARLLVIQAGFQSGVFNSVIALAAVLAWLLLFFGAARAARLSPDRSSTPAPPVRGEVFVLGACLLLSGLLLGPLETAIVLPAISDPASSYQAGLSGVTMASGSWQVLTLAGPLLAIGALLTLLGRPDIEPIAAADPPPLLRLPWSGLREGARRLTDLRPPPLGFFKPLGSERAMATGAVGLWTLVFAILAVVVLR